MHVAGVGRGHFEFGRREFLQWSTAALALAATACTRKPLEKIVPYAQQPEETLPGVPNGYASTCRECPAGCGVIVKTLDQRPIKLEGNPLHPLNQGSLCARGQAALLNLYDPDRLAGALRTNRGGLHQPLGENEADAALMDALHRARPRGAVLLTGTIHGPARIQLVAEFVSQFGMRHVTSDAFNPDALTGAQRAAYGTAVIPRLLLDRVEVLVTLGADPLGTGYSRQEWMAGFGRQRKLQRRDGNLAMSRVVAFEPMLSLTGINADTRHPVHPGSLLPLALGLAHQMVIIDRHSSYATDATVASALAGFAPDIVEKACALPRGTIAALVAELWAHKGRSLVLGGDTAAATGTELHLQVVTSFLNTVLENEGATIEATASPSQQTQGSNAAMLQLCDQMQQGQIDVLMVYGANPAYTLPGDADFAEATKRVGFVASIAERLDETGQLADVVLPALHAMESWGDAEPRRGLFCLVQPTIEPLFKTRSFEDTLLSLMCRNGKTAPGIAAAPVAKGNLAAAAGVPPSKAATPTTVAVAAPAPATFYDYLRQVWNGQIYATNQLAATWDDFWTSALRDGLFDASQREPGPARAFHVAALAEATATQSQPEPPTGLALVLIAQPMTGDGSCNNNGLLLEAPDPISKLAWDNTLALVPETARNLGLNAGDVVEIAVGQTRVSAPVQLQPGVHSQVAVLGLGWGRTSVGTIGNNVGVNAYPLSRIVGSGIVYAGAQVKLVRMKAGYALASTQGHNYLDGRPIVREELLAGFLQALSRPPAPPGPPGLTLWNNGGPTEHTYPGYRWGMTIDLNACVGCQACVVACSVENNVPTVGKQEVINGREMHWLRIDRYYSGSPDNPDIVQQPMLCQNCDLAPCESVCPVLATVHNAEGLNLQVYNRCVGTRYCSNNCPYKVRHFNFYDYSGAYADGRFSALRGSPLELALNPQVTVRSKGVMEKCTFCVQRVNAAHLQAETLGRPISDGDIQTACQQTCPTQAIVFGNLNDSQSEVMRMRSGDNAVRAYRVLEHLNTQPTVVYLTRIRNRPEPLESSASPSANQPGYAAASGPDPEANA